jgi:DNA-directed RNA polymerase II subunit RPB1
MYHCGFIKAVLAVLRCVAYDTSQILLPADTDKYKAGLRIKNPEHRLRYFSKCCASMKLNPTTGAPQPQYRLEGARITAEFPIQKGEEMQGYAEGRQDLPAEKAHEILRRMTDDDINALGLSSKFSRPEWFVLTVLPIAPPSVRPDVMMDSSARSQDDITHVLVQIIRNNAELRRQEENGAPMHILQEIAQLVQFHITTMMNNSIPGMPVNQQKSGRPIKSIGQRLKGKEGRIRGNLMGKRVDFSARTVIGGDPLMELDQLGVPWSIALNLTYPRSGELKGG